MGTKKKYHGGYGLLFGVLFCLLLGFSSTTCYASQPTLVEMTNFIDLIKVKQNNGDLYSINKITGNSTSIAANFLNLSNDINFTLENVIFLPGVGYKTNGNWNSNNIQGVLLIANNTFSDTLPFLYIQYSGGSDPILYTTLANGNNWGAYYVIEGSNVYKYTNSTFLYSVGSSFIWSPNNDLTVLSNNVIFTKYKTSSIYVNYLGTYYPMLNNYNGDDYNTYYNIQPEPDEPSGDSGGGSTGTITDNNGDTTGKIDLSGIENGINNINDSVNTQGQNIINAISGESQNIINSLTNQPDLSQTEITKEQIENALDFDFMADPYANFWLEMTNGLSGALTNSVRQIPVDWLGYQGVFDLDELGFNYPAPVMLFLTAASTISMVWVLVRWWKIIVDKLTSGNMDEVLAMNEEERHSGLILRGCNND